LKVEGVLVGVGDGLDRTLVLVDQREFAELFATAGVHELALTAHGRLPEKAVAALALAAAPGADVRTWRQLMPQVSSLEEILGVATWLIALILSVAAGLGVLNAMLMAQYERIPEFGLLKALGTTPARIVGDVFVEALLLALVAVGVGLALGSLTVWYLHVVGIDITGADQLSVSGVTFGAALRARWSLAVFVQPVCVTLFTALAAALWPALKAARLDPVQALTHV
jgi:ABC-type antimicrobial peptide transport system permease subunit